MAIKGLPTRVNILEQYAKLRKTAIKQNLQGLKTCTFCLHVQGWAAHASELEDDGGVMRSFGQFKTNLAPVTIGGQRSWQLLPAFLCQYSKQFERPT